AYGNLFHTIADRFFREHGAAFSRREDTLPNWTSRGATIATEEYETFLHRYPLLGAIARRTQLARLLGDVERFLEYDWDLGRPRHFVGTERRCGESTPVAVELDGRSLHVRGRIDRLDVESGRTLVRDLKTGRSRPRIGDAADPEPVRD